MRRWEKEGGRERVSVGVRVCVCVSACVCIGACVCLHACVCAYLHVCVCICALPPLCLTLTRRLPSRLHFPAAPTIMVAEQKTSLAGSPFMEISMQTGQEEEVDRVSEEEARGAVLPKRMTAFAWACWRSVAALGCGWRIAR